MQRIQPPRAAKVKANARIRVYCPPATISLWDSLPTHLQAHIRALAAEMHARHVYPTVIQDVVVAAMKRKTKQLIHKAVTAHHARMTQRAWLARCAAMFRAPVPALQQLSHAAQQLQAATNAVVTVVDAYVGVKREALDMCVGVLRYYGSTHPICVACDALYDKAVGSAHFYALM